MEKLRYTGRDYRLSLFVIYTFLKKPSISFDAILFPILSHSLEKKARGDFIFRLLLFQTPHGFMLYAPFSSSSSFSLFPFFQCHNMKIYTFLFAASAVFTLKILCVIFTFSYFISFSHFFPFLFLAHAFKSEWERGRESLEISLN